MEDFRANDPSHWREMATEVRRSAELLSDLDERDRLLAKAQAYERLAYLAQTCHPMFWQRDD